MRNIWDGRRNWHRWQANTHSLRWWRKIGHVLHYRRRRQTVRRCRNRRRRLKQGWCLRSWGRRRQWNRHRRMRHNFGVTCWRNPRCWAIQSLVGRYLAWAIWRRHVRSCYWRCSVCWNSARRWTLCWNSIQCGSSGLVCHNSSGFRWCELDRIINRWLRLHGGKKLVGVIHGQAAHGGSWRRHRRKRWCWDLRSVP